MCLQPGNSDAIRSWGTPLFGGRSVFSILEGIDGQNIREAPSPLAWYYENRREKVQRLRPCECSQARRDSIKKYVSTRACTVPAMSFSAQWGAVGPRRLMSSEELGKTVGGGAQVLFG